MQCHMPSPNTRWQAVTPEVTQTAIVTAHEATWAPQIQPWHGIELEVALLVSLPVTREPVLHPRVDTVLKTVAQPVAYRRWRVIVYPVVIADWWRRVVEDPVLVTDRRRRVIVDPVLEAIAQRRWREIVDPVLDPVNHRRRAH